MWRLVIELDPLGQPRHRGWGKKTDKEKAWRDQAALLINSALRRDPPCIPQGVPVICTIRSYKARKKSLRGNAGPRVCVVVPDADNVAKIAQDCLNDATDHRGAPLVWHDDAQVASLIVHKYYAGIGEKPRVEVEIQRVDDEEAWLEWSLG